MSKKYKKVNRDSNDNIESVVFESSRRSKSKRNAGIFREQFRYEVTNYGKIGICLNCEKIGVTVRYQVQDDDPSEIIRHYKKAHEKKLNLTDNGTKNKSNRQESSQDDSQNSSAVSSLSKNGLLGL